MSHGLKEICFDLNGEESIINGACVAQWETKSLQEMFSIRASRYSAFRDPPSLLLPGQGHVQEVILRVAVEGAAEAHGVLRPSLVHL